MALVAVCRAMLPARSFYRQPYRPIRKNFPPSHSRAPPLQQLPLARSELAGVLSLSHLQQVLFVSPSCTTRICSAGYSRSSARASSPSLLARTQILLRADLTPCARDYRRHEQVRRRCDKRVGLSVDVGPPRGPCIAARIPGMRSVWGSFIASRYPCMFPQALVLLPLGSHGA